MKLAVLCSESLTRTLPGLRILLDGLFIESLAWFESLGQTKVEKIDLLERTLDYSAYVLCITSRSDLESWWIHYALGHQAGRRDRLVLWFPTGMSEPVPGVFHRYPMISDAEADVLNILSEIQSSWEELVQSDLARSMLEEHHIEVSSRSMVDAVIQGDRFILGLFLECGFSPSICDESGVPLLNLAIRAGHFPLIRPLLHAGADPNGIGEDRHTSPIMDAAAIGLDKVVVQLLDLDVELEYRSRDGQTALTLAVGNNRISTAIILAKAGADADTADLLGMSARKYASLYNQEAILAILPESN